MLKFQSATKILNFWQIAKTFIIFNSPLTILFMIRFGLDWVKIVGVAFEIFAPIGSHVNENEKINIVTN